MGRLGALAALLSWGVCCALASVNTSAFLSPVLTKVKTLAVDPTGNLRDPSAMVQDPATGLWHFWVVYIPGGGQPGWRGYLHHYSSPAFDGPFTNQGLALNHSTDPAAFDNGGMFSPSALYDPEEKAWYLFYSGTGANYSKTKESAQLVATAPSPDGPWQRLGLVAFPTAVPPFPAGYNATWNARRCDSGRAMIVGGTRGYWTKGVKNFGGRDGYAQEGVYFPVNASTFRPPYAEWEKNPIMHADGSTDPRFKLSKGYENCEFFMGPGPAGPAGGEPAGLLHVLCQSHSGGQPHFVTNVSSHALDWTYIDMISTAPALEPTPVYVGGQPGSEASVTHFIARTTTGKHGAGALSVALYELSWKRANTTTNTNNGSDL